MQARALRVTLDAADARQAYERHLMEAQRNSVTELAAHQPIAGEHWPQNETTRTQVRHPRRLPVEALEYHLFRPRSSHDPLLERAYELWREGWRTTLFELDGTTELHSDEFGRQDEIGVLALDGSCVALTGIRWLDMSLPRAREDSYFRSWPADAVAMIADRVVTIASNTLVHPAWRGTIIEPPLGHPGDSVRLAFTTNALSTCRFLASSAQSLIALTRNDRAIDRVMAALGSTRLARIQMHGIETDIVRIERRDAIPEGPVVGHLWSRRHQT
jgi:hypothetical protein